MEGEVERVIETMFRFALESDQVEADRMTAEQVSAMKRLFGAGFRSGVAWAFQAAESEVVL